MVSSSFCGLSSVREDLSSIPEGASSVWEPVASVRELGANAYCKQNRQYTSVYCRVDQIVFCARAKTKCHVIKIKILLNVLSSDSIFARRKCLRESVVRFLWAVVSPGRPGRGVVSPIAPRKCPRGCRHRGPLMTLGVSAKSLNFRTRRYKSIRSRILRDLHFQFAMTRL